mgnify:FL=1
MVEMVERRRGHEAFAAYPIPHFPALSFTLSCSSVVNKTADGFVTPNSRRGRMDALFSLWCQREHERFGMSSRSGLGHGLACMSRGFVGQPIVATAVQQWLKSYQSTWPETRRLIHRGV